MPVGDSTLRKVSRRILPFFFVLYIVAYLDRANVSFAKLPMSADLGFTEAVFGLGAGLFFAGYFVLEIPGALIVERWSARLWIARILVTWGLCTILVGFVKTPLQFYAARFLLGLAEAGFFPGAIVYMTHWFPAPTRARALAGFILAVPISFVIGAPASALCLSLDWFGLPGWRWIFILQGLPAVVLGLITPFFLTDRPAQARWLGPDEREWLARAIEDERLRKRQSTGHISILRAFTMRPVLLLSLALFFIVIASYGYILWMPSSIQKHSGFSTRQATVVSGIPFALATIAVWFMGRSSDRSGERKLHTAIPLMLAGVFFALITIPGQPFALIMIWLCLTGLVLWGWAPSFWVLPTLILGESAAAASIGFINSIGNLGGFVGPSLVGYLLSVGWSFSTAVLFLCACFFAAAGLVFSLRIPLRPEARS